MNRTLPDKKSSYVSTLIMAVEMRDGRLVEFSRRMNEIRREFLRISEDIPENFKSQYAAYEIKKRQNNLIQFRPITL